MFSVVASEDHYLYCFLCGRCDLEAFRKYTVQHWSSRETEAEPAQSGIMLRMEGEIVPDYEALASDAAAAVRHLLPSGAGPARPAEPPEPAGPPRQPPTFTPFHEGHNRARAVRTNVPLPPDAESPDLARWTSTAAGPVAILRRLRPTSPAVATAGTAVPAPSAAEEAHAARTARAKKRARLGERSAPAAPAAGPLVVPVPELPAGMPAVTAAEVAALRPSVSVLLPEVGALRAAAQSPAAALQSPRGGPPLLVLPRPAAGLFTPPRSPLLEPRAGVARTPARSRVDSPEPRPLPLAGAALGRLPVDSGGSAGPAGFASRAVAGSASPRTPAAPQTPAATLSPGRSPGPPGAARPKRRRAGR